MSFPKFWKNWSRRQKNTGFTLVEVLVAMGVLMIGLTSALALIAAAASTHKKSIDQTNAAFIAEAVVASVEQRLHNVNKLDELMAADQQIAGYPLYRYSVFVHPLNQDQSEVLVAVSVYWDSGGRKLAKTYQTILLREIPALDQPKKSD